MSKRKKRLDKIRQNPKNISPDTLRQVLEDYGFSLERIVGSHYHFSYDLNGQKELFTVPFKRPIKTIYIKSALKLIDQIIEERGEDEEADD